MLANNNKKIDEYLVSSALNNLSTNNKIIERLYNFIHKYLNYNKDLSHTFWQNSIEVFMKFKLLDYVNSLIRIYPIKYSYSESFWSRIINVNMNSKDLMIVFNIFLEKFQNRINMDEYRCYENIFNLFLEFISIN